MFVVDLFPRNTCHATGCFMPDTQNHHHPLLVMSFVYMRIMIVASRLIKRAISYRRKFYKYTRRSVPKTGSGSRTTHEISGNISRLNGVRAVCEETVLSCDATALTEDHAEDSKLVHFAPQISESMPTQTPQGVEADTGTSRQPNGHSGHKTQGISQLNDDTLTKSRIGENHTKSFNNGSKITRTSDRQSKQWTNHLRISLWERACKTEKEKAAKRTSAKEYKAAKTLAVVVGGFVAC